MSAERLAPRGAIGLVGPYTETRVANGAATGAVGIDLGTGNVFELTLTGAVTLSFNNPAAAGQAHSFTLILKQDGTGGRAVTWPASVKWPDATAPTLATTANAVSLVTFLTTDGGATWLGMFAGKAFA